MSKSSSPDDTNLHSYINIDGAPIAKSAEAVAYIQQHRLLAVSVAMQMVAELEFLNQAKPHAGRNARIDDFRYEDDGQYVYTDGEGRPVEFIREDTEHAWQVTFKGAPGGFLNASQVAAKAAAKANQAKAGNGPH